MSEDLKNKATNPSISALMYVTFILRKANVISRDLLKKILLLANEHKELPTEKIVDLLMEDIKKGQPIKRG